jgi:hypothetical protein
LRGFVEAVWGSRPTPQMKPGHDDVWLVPDTRAGLSELARITTRRQNGARIDFFELYWSDLLVGNTLAQIRAWVTGLLLRWPHQVPRETFGLWLALWLIAGLMVALAAFVGLSDAVKGIWSLFRDAEVVRNGWAAAASLGLTAALYALLWLRLSGNLRSWHKPDEVFLGIWSTVTPRDAAMSVGLSRAVALLLPPVIGLAAFLWFPWMVLWALKPWLLILAAVIALVLSVWVVPVFGDVARYVRTSPDAVAARAAIRDRGVDLLRALHGPMAGAEGKAYEPGGESPYDRIVVVGHSLGSIVAYDILRLFWEERGPTRNNPASPEALKALRAMDAFCRTSSPAPGSFDVAEFRSKAAGCCRSAGAAGEWLARIRLRHAGLAADACGVPRLARPCGIRGAEGRADVSYLPSNDGAGRGSIIPLFERQPGPPRGDVRGDALDQHPRPPAVSGPRRFHQRSVRVQFRAGRARRRGEHQEGRPAQPRSSPMHGLLEPGSGRLRRGRRGRQARARQ